MEKEKYYTPKPEEFYIGFEFQYKNIQGIWVDLIFEANMIVNYPKENKVESIIYSWLKEGKVRVKYLDREDIESFGFKHYNEENAIERYELNGYFLYWYGNPFLSICKIDMSNQIFRGGIKNKSEFSRLLKQLSII